jgi:hypothetical protein
MKQGIGLLIAAVTLGLTTAALAQGPTPVRLLTGGVVKHVDSTNRIVVLDNGRRVQASIVMIDGVHADIARVQPGSQVMVSGVEMAESRPAALPPGTAQPR